MWKDDHVASFHLHRGMRLTLDDALAVNQHVEQHHAFRVGQDEGGEYASGGGDSTAHGDENSAVKNTAPDRRTTRSTSERTSIAIGGAGQESQSLSQAVKQIRSISQEGQCLRS